MVSPEATQERPGDVVVRGIRPLGQLAYLDVAVSNPLQKSLPKIAALCPNYASDRRAAAKLDRECVDAVTEATAVGSRR